MEFSITQCRLTGVGNLDNEQRLGRLLGDGQDYAGCRYTNLDTLDIAKIQGRSVNEFLLEGFNTTCFFMYADFWSVALDNDVRSWKSY